MKKILSILVVLALCFVPMAFAVENGTSVKEWSGTVYSSATGTTGAVTATTVTYDNVMKYLACDFISGPASAINNVTFVVYGNQGSSSTLFDSTAYLITSQTLTTSATLSTMKTVVSNSGVPKPFRSISTVITSPTTTQVITVNCTAMQ